MVLREDKTYSRIVLSFSLKVIKPYEIITAIEVHMRILCLTLVLSFTISAQTPQPLKESSDDLRTGLTMFSIQEVGDKTIYQLERTSNMDYFLRMKSGEEEKVLKVSSREAKKLDMDFASKFLKCQYELPPSDKDCLVTLRLTMKGEGQDICQKDDKKTQELAPLLHNLEKRF
jgi:hypothetical protein